MEIPSVNSFLIEGCSWRYQHQVPGGPRENGLMFAGVSSLYLTCFKAILTHFFPTRNILVFATLNRAGQQVFNLSSSLQ